MAFLYVAAIVALVACVKIVNTGHALVSVCDRFIIILVVYFHKTATSAQHVSFYRVSLIFRFTVAANIWYRHFLPLLVVDLLRSYHQKPVNAC